MWLLRLVIWLRFFDVPIGERGHADRRPEVLTGRLRAAHVIAGLDPVYGGPSYSVPRLCEALAVAGAGTMLLSVAREGGRPTRCV